MKKLALAFALIVALATGAEAKKYNLPKEDAVATVDIPASWTVEQEDELLTAVNKDEDVEFSFEVLEKDQIEGAVEESLGYLKKNKVKVKTKSSEKTTGEINGLKTTCYAMEGEDEDGACHISLIFVALSDDKYVSILYWAPEKVEASEMEAIKGIVNSIKEK